MNEIKRLNNLSTNLLKVGTDLFVPTETDTYIVKSGDTLYSIANAFNTTVDTIKKLNNLTSNLLSIDQELIIQ